MTLDSLVSEVSHSTQARCFCGQSVGKDRVTCPHCETHYHKDCWAYNGGCATYACGYSDRSASSGALLVPVDPDEVLFNACPGSSIMDLSAKKVSLLQMIWDLVFGGDARPVQPDHRWINSYLSGIRDNRTIAVFTPVSRSSTMDDAIRYCKSRISVMVTAGQEALARVIDSDESPASYFTRTAAIGFLSDEGVPLVAYADMSLDEIHTIHLMDEAVGLDRLPRRNPAVDGMVSRATGQGRVVPAPSDGSVRFSCIPDGFGTTDAENDAGLKAALGKYLRPYSIMCCHRLDGGLDFRSISSSEIWGLDSGCVKFADVLFKRGAINASRYVHHPDNVRGLRSLAAFSDYYKLSNIPDLLEGLSRSA